MTTTSFERTRPGRPSQEEDPAGEDRTQEADQGKPPAGKATLGRLEHAPPAEEETDRYHPITAEADRIADLFVDLFVEDLEEPDGSILDLDTTLGPLHGKQEDRFFHGYYDCYCYLPLYIFCGEELLCAKLRRSNIDPSAGCLPEIKRIVGRTREKWPEAEIILRADSGFARERIMKWCEENGVNYVFGLAKNSRLKERVEGLMAQVEEEAKQSGEPVRQFTGFFTAPSKAGAGSVGAWPRPSISPIRAFTRIPTARGVRWRTGSKSNNSGCLPTKADMSANSAHRMRVNQMRLWLASLAYVLIARLRKWGLQETEWARAQVWT